MQGTVSCASHSLISGGKMKITIRSVQFRDAEDITSILREVDWFEHLKTESAQRTAKRVDQYISLCLAANQCHAGAILLKMKKKKLWDMSRCITSHTTFCRDRRDIFLNCLFHQERADKESGRPCSNTSLRRHGNGAVRGCRSSTAALVNRTGGNSTKSSAGGNGGKLRPLFYPSLRPVHFPRLCIAIQVANL